MAKKRFLTFTTAEVALAVADAVNAAEHRCNFEDLYNPDYHKGGVVKNNDNGFPDSDNIDNSKIPAALWLVKDQGAYLMSNGKFKEGQERAVLAYAHECHPEKLPFDEWWENARDIMGGDDCGITLPIGWFEAAVKAGSPSFKLQVLANSVRLVL